jgi:hypothetical protein
MGIFVPSATLPAGIQLSNVYMSFSGEMVYTAQMCGGWRINSFYKVFSDQQTKKSNIRIDTTVLTHKLDDPYKILYSELKNQYPEAIDVFEEGQAPPPVPVIEEESQLVVDGTCGEHGHASLRCDSE